MPGRGSQWKVVGVAALGALALVLLFVNIVWPALKPAASPQPAASAPPPARKVPARGRARGEAAAQSLDPTLRLKLLASVEGVQYKGSGRNIFRGQAEAPIPTPIKDVLKKQPEGPPQPPPINLKFYGFASKPGESKKIFLSQGDDIFIASEGDIVNRRYHILHIGVNTVEVEDVLDKRRQVIPLTQG